MFKINIYKLKTLFSLIIPCCYSKLYFINYYLKLLITMVGQLSEVAISGIGSANSFYFIVTGVLISFVGACIICATL